MEGFGRCPVLFGRDQNLHLAWLAGLLEAEGTFIQPTPSEPRLPVVACQMTDRDVVARVASMFDITVTTIHRTGRRTMYGTRLKGSRAVRLMHDLSPLMGERRTRAISAATDAYSAPRRKLDFATAEWIRALRTQGATVSGLALAFGVARPTIRQVLDRSIYGAAEVLPWRGPGHRLPNCEWHGQMSLCELYWLAGWLEGEGSFLRGPPSDPRRPRITAQTRDGDVANEVGRLLQVTPWFSHADRERRRGWSPMWGLLRRGQIAVKLMKALHPLMGARRRSQIEAALAAPKLGR